mgnify:CR=1 FL=1
MGDQVKTLELQSCVDGWVKVSADGEHTEYVACVKICGNAVSLESGQLEIECQEWSVVRDRYPTLLVEVPNWYSEPDDDA